MSLNLLTSGVNVNATTQINGNFREVINLSLKNAARESIDHAQTFSTDGTDLISEAFVDANGQNNLVNTGNTTALFKTNKYGLNVSLGTPESRDNSGTDPNNSFTTTITALTSGIFTEFKAYNGSTDGRTGALSVTIQDANGVTLASKTSSNVTPTNTATLTFAYSDYTRAFKVGEIISIVTSFSNMILGGCHTNASDSFTGTNFSYTNQRVLSNASGNEYTYTPLTNTSASEFVELDLPSGTFSSTVSKLQGTVITNDWETGASINCKLLNGSEDSGWLPINEIGSFTAFTTQPTKAQFQLVPKSSSPTAGYPSIKAVAIKGW